MSALDEAGLRDRLREAMRQRATLEVAVIRALLAAVKNTSIERRPAGEASLGEADIVQIVRREIKQRDEAIEFAERAGRTDLIEKNRAELDLLRAFLPQEVTREEIQLAVRRHAAAGASAIGALMNGLKSEFGARLDGRLASEVVREYLKEQGGS